MPRITPDLRYRKPFVALAKGMSAAATVLAVVMNIGIIGAGNIGSVLAKLAVDHGHTVVIANSRGPETLRDLVVALAEGRRYQPGTPAYGPRLDVAGMREAFANA
jgi:predicted dinucleotide-binding enzyme